MTKTPAKNKHLVFRQRYALFGHDAESEYLNDTSVMPERNGGYRSIGGQIFRHKIGKPLFKFN